MIEIRGHMKGSGYRGTRILWVLTVCLSAVTTTGPVTARDGSGPSRHGREVLHQCYRDLQLKTAPDSASVFLVSLSLFQLIIWMSTFPGSWTAYNAAARSFSLQVVHEAQMACRDLAVAFSVCAPIVVTHAHMTELCLEFRFHLCFLFRALSPERSTWLTAWCTLEKHYRCSAKANRQRTTAGFFSITSAKNIPHIYGSTYSLWVEV